MNRSFAVVGSGISGLSISRMLVENDCQVEIYEKASQPGGLIKCSVINNCLFHRVGGHVFNSVNEEVLAWFWKHFDREKEFIKAKRNAKAYFDGRTIGYPIENFLFQLPISEAEKIVREIMELSGRDQRAPMEYPDFESFLRGNFGNTLFDIYFGPYNRKIWKVDLSTVSMQWLEGKLPMPRYTEMILNNILRREESRMVHATFYYPKQNGSQFIVNRLAEGLSIKCDTTITDVEWTDNKVVLNRGDSFDGVVWCGDIRHLPISLQNLLIAEGVNMKQLSSLRSNGTSNLFCETDDTDVSWLYIPEDFTSAHRIIYTGNFAASNNAGSLRKTCVVEFSGEVSPDVMKEEIKKLPGNLTPVTHNYEPNSYVIQEADTRALINEVRRILAKKNVYILGRFAEWEYYNMDKCIEASFLLTKTILNK